MIRVVCASELPPNHVNFLSRLFQKLHGNKQGFEVVDNVLYQTSFKHVGHGTHRQIVVTADAMDGAFRALYYKPMQGHPGSSKMLHELRARVYSPPNLAEKVQHFVDICQMCIRTKSCHD